MPVSVLLTRTAPSRLSSSARRSHAALRGKLKPPRPHLFRVRASAMEKVTFGDAAVPGYECGEKTAPGVIVLQEWWGVTENIKKQALFISSKVTGRPTTRCRLLPPPQCLRDSNRFFVSSIHHSGSAALPSNGVSFRAQQQQHVHWSHSTLKSSPFVRSLLSTQGYRCLVPDLYKGKLGVNVEEAHHLMSNLDWPAAKGALEVPRCTPLVPASFQPRHTDAHVAHA